MELKRLRDHAGYSALHCAARDGQDERVVDLLREGADKNALDTFGATPLMHAAEEGHLPVTETLLTAGADLTVHNTEGGDTALHLAARGGYDGIVNALLAGGADKDSSAENGSTPLMEAARKGHLPVVDTLLNVGADVTLVCDEPYGHWCDDAVDGECTALHLATYGRHLGVVNALLSKGADKDWRGPWGMTALMVAVREGDLSIIRCLLTEGADVDALDDSGESALLFALDESSYDRGCIPKFVETLLAEGANPNIGRTLEMGYTPLGLAVLKATERGHWKGDTGAMKSLIAYGAGVNTRFAYGHTPLHVACYYSDDVDHVVVNFLLRSGASSAQSSAATILASTNSRRIRHSHHRELICGPLLDGSSQKGFRLRHVLLKPRLLDQQHVQHAECNENKCQSG